MRANFRQGHVDHYAAPGRVIDADPAGIAALRETLDAIGADYVTGRTWTTDAFYREPRTRIARRVEEGCLVVEMEAAAFIAVARFRGCGLGSCSTPETVWPERNGITATGSTRRTPGPACSTSPRPLHCASTPPDAAVTLVRLPLPEQLEGDGTVLSQPIAAPDGVVTVTVWGPSCDTLARPSRLVLTDRCWRGQW